MKRFDLLFIITLFLLSCQETQEALKPKQTDMTVSVYASVVIQPEGLYSVYAEASGIIESIAIEEGSLIKKGQVIAKIKRENKSYDLQSAQLNQQLAEDHLKGKANKLASIEIDISRLKNQLLSDSTTYFRQKKLWESNIGSKQTLDDRKLKYEIALENLAAAKKRYTQTKTELENAYSISRNNLKKSQSILGNYDIKAKRNGKVYQLNREEGEFISLQEVFAEVGSTQDFIIEMQIDEVDIVSIQLNQTVMVALDAYPDQILEAKVSKIYPSKNIRTQTFKVEALFRQPPRSLYAGLSGEANIITSVRQNVLTIPLEYIKDRDKVITAEGKEVKVELGMRNMDEVEILSGIDSSTALILFEGV